MHKKREKVSGVVQGPEFLSGGSPISPSYALITPSNLSNRTLNISGLASVCISSASVVTCHPNLISLLLLPKQMLSRPHVSPKSTTRCTSQPGAKRVFHAPCSVQAKAVNSPGPPANAGEVCVMICLVCGAVESLSRTPDNRSACMAASLRPGHPNSRTCQRQQMAGWASHLCIT